jgi:hypothetical protein
MKKKTGADHGPVQPIKGSTPDQVKKIITFYGIFFVGDVQIQTDPNKKYIDREQPKTTKNLIFLKVFQCLFVKIKPDPNQAEYFFIGFWIDFSKPIQIKPHTYILILIYLFISMIYCINLFFLLIQGA